MAKWTPREKLWSTINLHVGTYFVLLFASVWTPEKLPIWSYEAEPRILVSCIMGWLFNRMVDAVKRVLGNYEPMDALDAKRTNEQIKSMSVALNASAAAAVTVFAFSQIAKDFSSPNWPLVLFAVGLGLYVHSGARGLLGMLKDEAATAYPVLTEEVAVASV